MLYEVITHGAYTLIELPAAQLRDRTHPAVVTYSPKVFLPITNLCRDRCSYCTFRRDPTSPGQGPFRSRSSSGIV